MDCHKVGELILKLRQEKKMTQKQVAYAIGISDKTVSKWERGLGMPDVSLLNDLAKVLGVNVERILVGELDPNALDGGNMKKIKFYACPSCYSVINGTGEVDISCCGRRLEALTPRMDDEAHQINIEEIETEYYLQIDHEMSKEHYISFVACVTYNSLHLVKLYPEQAAELRIPRMVRGMLYMYCNRHGLIGKRL